MAGARQTFDERQLGLIRGGALLVPVVIVFGAGAFAGGRSQATNGYEREYRESRTDFHSSPP
jgi:hypothetical protein